MALSILILISILLFVYILYSLKLSNPYKTTLICGSKGSGKSTYAVHIALKYLNKKFWEWDSCLHMFVSHRWHVYTNMEMNIDGVNYISQPELLGRYTVPEYSVLILDEINTLPGWDNRDFKNMAANTIKWMRYSRQYKVRCFFCLRPGTVTKRLSLLLTIYLSVAMWLLSLSSFARSKNELQ